MQSTENLSETELARILGLTIDEYRRVMNEPTVPASTCNTTPTCSSDAKHERLEKLRDRVGRPLDNATPKQSAATRPRSAENGSATVVSAPSDNPINYESDPFTDAILNPPGLFGDVVAWIRNSSGMHQPKFALAAGLTACGALLSRLVCDQDGQRTNIYTLAVGATSAGKNDPIRAIQTIMLGTGRNVLLAGEVTSDSAVEVMLDMFPAKVMLLDEVGHYLGSIKSAGQSNGYLKTVVPMLTKAWSAAAGALLGKTRAPDNNGNVKPSKIIRNPCVSVYGTSAPDVLFGAMNEGDFADGSIPRFLSFISETRPMYQPKGELALPYTLALRLKQILGALGATDGLYKFDSKERDEWPTPRTFKHDEDALADFADFENEKMIYMLDADAGDKPLYLWGKAVENAKRVALVVAAINGQDVIDGAVARYAIDLVRACVKDMINHVRRNVAGSRREREKKTVLRVIRLAGTAGIVLGELTRKTQSISRDDRRDYLLDLEEAGQVRTTYENGTGAKSIKRFLYCGQER